jgi:hypothetical protein
MGTTACMSYYINCILPSASKEAMAWGPAGERGVDNLAIAAQY